MLQRPKNQQKKLHSQRPVHHQHIMVTMDPAIIPVITMLANTVHSRIATVMVIINGNSMVRDMEMHTTMHGVVIAAAAAAITKTKTHLFIYTVVTFFLFCFFFLILSLEAEFIHNYK